MNKHITEYNNGKQHQPILKVRVSEPKGAKYQVGKTGNKTSKLLRHKKEQTFILPSTKIKKVIVHTVPSH